MVRIWIGWLAVGLAFLTLGLGGCGLKLLTWDQEVAMGLEAAPQMTAEFGGATPDDTVQAYVDEVGAKLVDGIEQDVPSDLPWSFTLLDSGVINAFALPGGQVYISRGLAERFSSEAEMAGVLGHEIGHVTARHGNQRISAQIGLNLLLTGASIAVGAADEDSVLREYGSLAVPGLSIGSNVLLLKYGRDEELEADMLGMRYMARAGYNPIGQRRVMETLQAASGPRSQPEWLSTHPASSTRIARIDELLATEFAGTQRNASFVTNEAAYERRMLARLARLPPPRHGSQGLSLLDTPSLWCVHCASAAGSSPNSLDQLPQAMRRVSSSE